MLISLETVRRWAEKRRAGYVEAVLAAGRQRGGQVEISAAVLVALGRRFAMPQEVRLAGGVEQRETVCRACEWLDHAWPRCVHPNCGCPRSRGRLTPWLNVRRCPAGVW